MARRCVLVLAVMFAAVGSDGAAGQSPGPTWTADNGNGTFSNPLFYDEFSDPDMIRVGDDFYMTGTTMHSMPGLPVLHSHGSRELALPVAMRASSSTLGRRSGSKDGESVYGQGIWAPSFRYHDGTFHIFSNVNGHTTQHYSARRPARAVDAHAHEASSSRPVGAVR